MDRFGRTLAGALVVTAMLALPATAQDDPAWSVGRWQGSLEGFTAAIGPERTMNIVAVTPDGAAQGTWYVSARQPASAQITVKGGAITVVPGAGGIAQLKRTGDDELVGSFTVASGRAFPVTMRRIKPSTEFDGVWSGTATPRPPDCLPGTYELTIKDSEITGMAEFLPRGEPARQSTVTGEIKPDKTAALRLTAKSPGSRTSRFSGAFAGNDFKAADGATSGRCSYDIWLRRT